MNRKEIESWLLENRNIDGLAVKWHVDLLGDFQAAQNKIHNSDYAKCLDNLKKQVEWNGWEERYLVNILKKHFAYNRGEL